MAEESLRLNGPQIQELRNLLRSAFPRNRFDEFLLYRLDRHADDYAAPADDYPTVLRRVIQEANAALWWRDLVSEARKDRKSTRLNSSHGYISYAVFCLKKKKDNNEKTIDVHQNRYDNSAQNVSLVFSLKNRIEATHKLGMSSRR